MNKKVQLITGLAAIVLIASGCESRFAESSPSSVKIEGLPLEERISQKAQVDSRINEIQKGAEKIKKIMDLFKKIQDPKNTNDTYSTVDFILDINQELKEKMPENKDGQLIRRGQITLANQTLSAECRIVDTMLESSTVHSDDGADSIAIVDRLTYSLKTCASKGKYLPAVTVDWDGPTLEVSLINENLSSIFTDLLVAEVNSASARKLKKNEAKIIDSIACENFGYSLSNNEYAFIKKMNFSNSDDIRFEAYSDIYESLVLKAKSKIKVLANGEVSFDVEKLETPLETKNKEK